MAEIKKIANAKAWEEGKELLKNQKSSQDFTPNGMTSFKPAKGEKFIIKNPITIPNGVDKDNKPKGYGAVECYNKKGEFIGYMTLRKLYGYHFEGVQFSTNSNKYYEKNTPKNSFVKNGETILGTISLGDKLQSKPEFEAVCLDTYEQTDAPIFGADLSAKDYQTEVRPVYILDIK